MQREAIPQVAHDVVAVGPEADDEGPGAVAEDPNGHGRFGLDGARVPDEVDCGEGADGVGYVVCAVGEGGGGGGEDLQEGVGVFGFVVVVGCAGVHGFEITGEDGRFFLLGDHVDVDAVEEEGFGFGEEGGGIVPRLAGRLGWSGCRVVR